MVNEHSALYPYSSREASANGEIMEWKKSFRSNIHCAQLIEDTIRLGFDGMHLKEDCAKGVIEEYGFKRVAYVLANTLRELAHDGRFSVSNKEWGRTIFVPPDQSHNIQFVVRSHPAVLDGFINLYRKELSALQMFDRTHCDTLTGQELAGKVLVMSPFTLKESYWAPENQLWLATGGFGCSPTASGRAVYATCLGDEEHVRWNREDFIGILKEEHLPDWAKAKLEQMTEQAAPARGEMTMG